MTKVLVTVSGCK